MFPLCDRVSRQEIGLAALDIELGLLEQAAATGDIKTLQEALLQWQEYGWASNTFREQRGNALYLAIHNRQHETAEYLLQDGLCITSNAVTEAVHLQSIETLDLLLNSDWDVNMQLGLTIPSALAYVWKI
nr:hypothetical protein CFP56_19559 [Quercus suber]